jgi:hypothetical protein
MPLLEKVMCAPPICAGQERWLLYFALFLDESGKVHQPGYAALCGYVATVEEWARFGQAWAQLQIKWNVPALHMSKIMVPERDAKWESVRKRVEALGNKWEHFRDLMLNEFCALIANSNIASVGAVIDTAAYSAIKDGPAQDYLVTHADCNVYLFQHALMAALDIVEQVDKSGMLTVCIDDDEEHAFDYYKSYWTLQKMVRFPDVPPHLKANFERIPLRVDQLSFGKDTFHPALQASDILAYVSRVFKTEKPPIPRFNDLLTFLTRGGTYPIKDYPDSAIRAVAGNTARKVQERKREEN